MLILSQLYIRFILRYFAINMINKDITKEIKKSQVELQNAEFVSIRNFYIRFYFKNEFNIPSYCVASFEETANKEFSVVIRELVGGDDLLYNLKKMKNRRFSLFKHDTFTLDKVVTDKGFEPLYCVTYKKCFIKKVLSEINSYTSDGVMSYRIICGYKDTDYEGVKYV